MPRILGFGMGMAIPSVWAMGCVGMGMVFEIQTCGYTITHT